MAIPGFTVDHRDVVDSTQNVALQVLRDSGLATEISGRVIVADRQTSGRGRQGRVWETPTGNLAATMIWHLDAQDNPGDYSLIVAVSWADAMAQMIRDSKSLSIKWPNDILVNGQKISGILIERPEPEWLLIGTGVNVAYAPEGRTFLADHVGVDVDLTLPHLLDLYLTRFDHWVATYRREGIGPICDAWMTRAYGVGQPMSVRLPHETFSAVFRGLDPDGAARAELLDGHIRRIYSGEVFFG